MRRKDREVTDINEIIEIIKSCKTCHLGIMDEKFPYVVPLSVGYDLNEDNVTLYFHCAKEGKKIELLKKNNQVSFEMCNEGKPVFAEKTPCNSGYYYSSVMGNGKAIFIDDYEEKAHALTRIVFHQAGFKSHFTKEQANAVCVFKVNVENISGKKKPSPM